MAIFPAHGTSVPGGTWRFPFTYGALFALTLALLVLVSIYSALELRPLYADGARYFFMVVEHQDFHLVEPARNTVQHLKQFPLVLALAMGVTDLEVLAIIFGAAEQLLPIVFVAFCYLVLPERRKIYFAFPLLHLLAGYMSTAFAAISEGSAAAAYFWLLFFLLLFRSDRLSELWLVLLLAIPFFNAHESTIFLIPFLCFAAVWKFLSYDDIYRRIPITLVLLALLFTLYHQVGSVIEPRSAENKELFLLGFVKLHWLYSGQTWNLPAVGGILALAALVLLQVGHLAFAAKPLVAAAMKLAWVLILVAVVGIGWHCITGFLDAEFNPYSQFAARNHPAFVSLPLAAVTLMGLLRPRWSRSWGRRANMAVIAALAATSIVWHSMATYAWAGYVADFRQILASNAGFVPWEAAIASLPEEKARRFAKMSWSWTTPLMSVDLARQGRVTTIIGNEIERNVTKFDPLCEDSLPKSPLFDTSIYIEATRRLGVLKSGDGRACVQATSQMAAR